MNNPQYHNPKTEDVIFTATCATTGEDLTSVLCETFKHGSVRGFFAEHLTTHKLSQFVTPCNEKHADNRTIKSNYPVECKSLTKGGLKLCRSGDVGEGRRIDKVAFELSAVARDFIVADTTKFTHGRLSVEWVIISGSEAAKFGPSTGSYTKARTLFQGKPQKITKW